MLKAQNSAAQAAIQGALNGPDHPPKGILQAVPCVILYLNTGMGLLTVEFYLFNAATFYSK